MPKRSYEEKFDYYRKKMEKLKRKHRSKRMRLESTSSSEGRDVEVTHDPVEPLPEEETTLEDLNPAESYDLVENDPPIDPPQADYPPLDPDILSALGEATDPAPTWGIDIHSNLPQLWQPLLKKGMNKEAKDNVLKEYRIPANCPLLQAPKLNIEISSAVAEMTRIRDKKVEATQQQLGVGITAISRAMTILMTSDNKIEAIKSLSDGCRILCDLHFVETQARIKMVTPHLAKPFLNVVQDSERDETVFGTSLPDKIKASKTIEKQGLQIKKGVQPMKTFTQTQNAARPQFQGNWSGPSRYLANRGGRGAQRRYTAPSMRRIQPATTAAMPSAQPRPTQVRPRAPARP